MCAAITCNLVVNLTKNSRIAYCKKLGHELTDWLADNGKWNFASIYSTA